MRPIGGADILRRQMDDAWRLEEPALFVADEGAILTTYHE
jgi:hypothetical protein